MTNSPPIILSVENAVVPIGYCYEFEWISLRVNDGTTYTELSNISCSPHTVPLSVGDKIVVRASILRQVILSDGSTSTWSALPDGYMIRLTTIRPDGTHVIHGATTSTGQNGQFVFAYFTINTADLGSNGLILEILNNDMTPVSCSSPCVACVDCT